LTANAESSSNMGSTRTPWWDGPGGFTGGVDAVELWHLQVHDHDIGPVEHGLADRG
jgi:hypothetical protein